MNTPPRLVPEMASRRLIVLDFVRAYIARWDASPSIGEIAAGAGCSRSTARAAVRRLVAAGLLVNRKGPRGLALPGEIERARMLLGLDRAGGADAGGAVCPLPHPPVLDYPDGDDDPED